VKFTVEPDGKKIISVLYYPPDDGSDEDLEAEAITEGT
jgi:hypothetical protein